MYVLHILGYVTCKNVQRLKFEKTNVGHSGPAAVQGWLAPLGVVLKLRKPFRGGEGVANFLRFFTRAEGVR